MERSIDAVRRDRLGEESPEDQESPNTTDAPRDEASTRLPADKKAEAEGTSNGTPEDPGRLKAKPKRPENVIGRWSHPSPHSQAG